jgi:nucleotide-binding universal stress UspA family protein
MEALMKNVLLVVHDDVGQEARYQAALDVVRAVEGHLTCLDVTEYPYYAGTEYGLAGVLLDDERKRETANRSKLEQRLTVEGLPWNWIDITGQFANCISDAAGLADLIVVNRHLDSFPIPDMRAIASEALIKTNKPLLAVPEASRGIRLQGHAVIAWDGSDEATAALREAVPLLNLASKVTILEIDDGSVTLPGEEAATYLARHGIIATLRPKHPAIKGAGGEILKQVELLRPDYLVMGAFGHGRFREAVFGGVTRRMLSESPVPLFLAH